MISPAQQDVSAAFSAPETASAEQWADFFHALHAADAPAGLQRWDDPSSTHAQQVARVQREAAVILPAHLPVADLDVVYGILDRAEHLWTADCVIVGSADFTNFSRCAVGNPAADYGVLAYVDPALPEAVAQALGTADLLPDAQAYRHWDAVRGLIDAVTTHPDTLQIARTRFHAAVQEARQL
ncbi:hypothetical protein [Corynebacterium renale]|uniref:Uncharacterized protein n=1 Tax=Corynebacterium renale TaxID=1724 RepID=A0A2A9DJV4_9CORY|nr:hypothetical protein [Corynebacterium renale]PFG26968.1 hypothetical protein ATK06_0009 [Corynebacterium renale]SQI25220.1 Uncharacterised protein [Corynebacterium renale]